MLHRLLLAGLAVTPFILAPGNEDVARGPKMAWALVFALAISLTALYKGTLKPFKNVWALLLVGFCLLSFYLSPNPKLLFFGVPSGRFWSWEPLYQGIVFLLFTITIASVRINSRTVSRIIKTMAWCGAIMAGFVLLQAAHLDQFFEHRFGTYGHMAGTLGNPTLVGPFLCLALPLFLFKREYFLSGLLITAIIVTRSDVALIGLLATVGTFIALKNRRRFITTVSLGLAGLAVVITAYVAQPNFRQVCPDNERFLTWRQSVEDITTPVMQDSKKIYAMTGIGPGSFKYLFHAKHNTKNDNFLYAHNEYVNVMYELGVVGLLLFLGTIVFIFRQAVGKEPIENLSGVRRALISSLVGILVCSCGIFVLQVGTHIFYTLTIVGLLCNDLLS